MKKTYFVIIALVVFVYIIREIRKRRFSIKESFWWVLAALVMIILSIFPYSIDRLADFLKISYPPSLLFVLCIVFLVFINFRSSKKIAEQQEKIIELGQELAILKDKVQSQK